MMRRTTLVALIALPLLGTSLSAAQFDVHQEADGVTVTLDGELMTRYLIQSGPKPILWPLIGPTGKEMTRQYPMRDALDTERDDHVHHRSLWFTHGDVGGVDFWSESGKNGRIVHREFVTVEGGEQATIVARNDWLSAGGKKICEEQRTFEFHADASSRWIDVELAVKASEGPVKFGDTKEGSFGVRVAGTMKVDAEPGGRIVNSDGLIDKDAWGKRAFWVDYSGPVDGETVGLAILNHPTSFRFPTHWHVRTYGLFTANPFGWHDFERSRDVDGSYVLDSGQVMTLRYRVVLHKGNAESANLADVFDRYAKKYSDGK
jgi:hypothetical protein